MISEQAKVATSREWRELGFFYDRDDHEKKWKIVGAKSGLQKFAGLLREYASNSKNAGVSEHEHFGPYGYLEVGTWNVPQITEHWIAGPLAELFSLASVIDKKVANLGIGESVSLRSDFAPGSPYDLEISLRADGFDPVSEDANFS